MAQTPVSTPAAAIDLKDVQADVILGIPKRVETFIFFSITNVKDFRHVVGSEKFLKLITSTAQIQQDRTELKEHKSQNGGKHAPLVPLAAINISFTQSGLNKLGITDDLGDQSFHDGQLKAAKDLGDIGADVNGVFDPAWLKEFKADIHGLILIAGDSDKTIHDAEEKVKALLKNTIKDVLRVSGKVRPGAEKGHEHFGYMDGISVPAVKGVVTPLPGQLVVDPGVLLLGQPGDSKQAQRPAWARNGSFLVYRHLDQLVPEFDKFKHDNPLHPLEIGVEAGAELLGARLVGRWKSGAPVVKAPTKDDPALAADKQKNNDFDFTTPSDQTACPFAAHIRKTNPRSDLGSAGVAPHAFNRAGIPFGSEVTEQERRYNKTEHERGLAFVCYQSQLAPGFEFVQKSWANNPGFIFGKPQPPGFDPIIGQSRTVPRTINGFDPKAQQNNLPLPPDFVVSKGGTYLFVPPISALKNKIGTH